MYRLKELAKKRDFWFVLTGLSIGLFLLTGFLKIKYLAYFFFTLAFIFFCINYFWTAWFVIKGNKVIYRLLRRNINKRKK